MRKRLLLIRRVVGESMRPTLEAGQLVVATGYANQLQPNDMVIIRHGGLEKIKRIQKITADRLFVVGDNERSSLDSRSFGWLSRQALIGKVVWPRRLRTSIPATASKH